MSFAYFFKISSYIPHSIRSAEEKSVDQHMPEEAPKEVPSRFSIAKESALPQPIETAPSKDFAKYTKPELTKPDYSTKDKQ